MTLLKYHTLHIRKYIPPASIIMLTQLYAINTAIVTLKLSSTIVMTLWFHMTGLLKIRDGALFQAIGLQSWAKCWEKSQCFGHCNWADLQSWTEKEIFQPTTVFGIPGYVARSKPIGKIESKCHIFLQIAICWIKCSVVTSGFLNRLDSMNLTVFDSNCNTV